MNTNKSFVCIFQLLSLILEYATPKREKQDLLRYRAVGRLWANCADRLFKEPPFKITLELEEMLAHKKIYHVKTFIPMEVTVKGWLSIRKLLFLDDFSENIQILHLVGVEGVDPKADYPPDMPKLRKLIVNNQFEVYYKPGTTFNFIDNLAKVSPLLESFKVIYDEDVTQHFQGIRSNYTLPRLMTELKAVNADASSLGKILQQNNLQNLSDAEFHLKHTSSRYLDISRILNNQFGFINLKKLKLHFEPPQDAYIWMYPLSTLEEFETNVSIVTFDLITPLSGCLPKLKSLTCKGGLRTTFCTILMEGSNFENLQSLTLHGSIFARYDYRNLDELDWQFNEGKILEKITRPGFPRFPNLVSLTWKGFSRVVTERTIPRIFASANKLADLNISLHNIFVLCSRYFSDEFNSLGGTNFNRKLNSLLPAILAVCIVL